MSKNYVYTIFVIVLLSVVFWFLVEYTNTGNRIVRKAKKYIGILEIPQNKGFYNTDFEERIRKVGFNTGYEWCQLFVKLVLTESLKGKAKNKINSLITPSTQQTFNNLKNDKSGIFEIVEHPKAGDLVIWQKYGNPGTGHAGIIKKVYPTHFLSIEGNLSNKVSVVNRNYTGNNSMKIRGFIRINA